MMTGQGSWTRAIRWRVYELIILMAALGLIAAGYIYWFKSSSEIIRHQADDYHLLSNSHCLAAMGALRQKKSQMSLEMAQAYTNTELPPELWMPMQEYNCTASFFIARREIRIGLDLERRFADSRFDALTGKLARQLSKMLGAKWDFCTATDQVIADMGGLLSTLRQLVRLHSVVRDDLLIEMGIREDRQTFGFFVMVFLFLLTGLLVTKGGLKAIDADLARHRQAEEKLRISETKFNAIATQSTEGITVANPEGNYTFVNPAFCEMLGYCEEELLQMTVFDVKAPEQDTSSFNRSKTSEEALAIHVLLRRKDGTVFTSEVIGKMIDFDGQPQVLGTIRDITEKVKAEEQIRSLSLAIEQSPVCVVITDTDGRIEYVNSAFEHITGYSVAEASGLNLRLLESDETPDSRYNELWQAIARGERWQGELQSRKKNGDVFWEYSHFAPVTNDSGYISHYLAVKEDITFRKQQEDNILRQAHFDSLTDLPNRFLSLDRLSQLLNEAQRNNDKVAVLFLDLDDFKKVNDTLGHETGDKLLVEAAERLRSAVRSGDTVGRLGGDEFIVLLGGLEDEVDARAVTENLLNGFKHVFRIDGRELILTTSIGIAIFPEDGDTVSQILRNADSAMYHAKELGRGTYSYFTETMNHEVSRRLALEEQIHGALDRGEFELLYQPKIDVSNGTIIGTEALLRWHNPALGEVSPVEFVPIAEQTGLIVPIGRFVLIEALTKTAQWRKKHEPDFQIAVNLSPRQFRDPGLVSFIKDAIHQSSVTGHCLELEITEGVLLAGHSFVDDILSELSEIGVSIAMDDFGAGYSSLSYLRRYPFDVLKIDRSFISDITVDPADRKLINAVIAMAHGLNLKVVAEGVETEGQLNHLKEQNCDYAQGYLFSQPVSPEALTKMLEPGGGRSSHCKI
jgi:diguanylate cyclase (GGDEF)-like protein/PAS domain S-box-containing protein